MKLHQLTFQFWLILLTFVFLIWPSYGNLLDSPSFISQQQLLNTFKNRLNRVESDIGDAITGLQTKMIESDFQMCNMQRRIAAFKLSSPLTDDDECQRSVPMQIEKRKTQYSNSKGEVGNRAYNMPTGCQDLQQYGHFMDGYYIVQGVEGSNRGKLEIIFCDFAQPPNRQEERVGYIDVKTSPVYFYTVNGQEILNSGQALSSGTFKVPFDGVYHFSFSAVGSGATATLLVDGEKIGQAIADDTDDSNQKTMCLHSTLQLKKNSTVTLDAKSYDESKMTSHFTGWLLDQDIFVSEPPPATTVGTADTTVIPSSTSQVTSGNPTVLCNYPQKQMKTNA